MRVSISTKDGWYCYFSDGLFDREENFESYGEADELDGGEHEPRR